MDLVGACGLMMLVLLEAGADASQLTSWLAGTSAPMRVLTRRPGGQASTRTGAHGIKPG